jgi:hypothetical protein
MEQKEYFFIRMPKHQVDLEDLFGGEFNDETGEWRFAKTQKDAVFDYLYCSSEDEECTLTEFLDTHPGKRPKGGTPERVAGTPLLSDRRRAVSRKEEASSPSLSPPSRPRENKRDRLHRANSFNASDSSDEEDSSLERHYRRSRGVREDDLSRLKRALEKARLDDAA